MADLIKAFAKHFPKGLSKEIKAYMVDQAFLSSRYLFTRREGKQQFAYCTHCQKEYKTNGSLRQGDKTFCQKCGSQCKVKASGRGRQGMVDQAYFVYYEKSLVNPQAIVARGIHAFRDYRGDYREVKTGWATIAFYLFEPGKPGVNIQGSSWFNNQHGKIEVYWWKECKTVFEHPSGLKSWLISDTYSRDSIKKAVEGTSYDWSGWEKYKIGDMTKFFDLFSRYPCVEYLTKLGFTELVKERLIGNRTYGAINWNGKNLFKVLRISKNDLNDIKQAGITITFDTLKVLQLSKKDGSNFTPAEAHDITLEYQGPALDDLSKLRSLGSIRKITAYLEKQSKKDKSHYSHPYQSLIAWRDYIADSRKLQMDLTKENVIFPKKLHSAHQNTIKQVKVKDDEALNQKIKNRVMSLEKYCFEQQGLFLRPADSTLELINEGKSLNHCVGTYADRYAKGETNLFVIRKTSEPDKPYYTMEIRDNHISQVRGKNNCSPSDEVKTFIEEFKAEKLATKKTKTKVKIPA